MYTLSTGIELELWVIDETGRLCDGTAIADAHRRIEPEFIDPLASRLDGPKRLSTSAARRRRLQQASRLRADIHDLTDEEPKRSTFPT